MKMPGTGPSLSPKKHRLFFYAVVIMLVLAVAVSGVAAENTGTQACSEVDQSGNPACQDLPPAVQPVITGQGNNLEIAGDSNGVTSVTGQVKDLFPVVQGSVGELLDVAGLGVRSSINQTRRAGEYADPGGDGPAAGPDSDSADEGGNPDIKSRIIELSEIAGSGLKSSINQTLHADEYPSLTSAVPFANPDNISEGVEGEPAPNILRTAYANIIQGVLLFIDITPRAIKGSLRNYSSENKSIWTNLSSDDLIGSPLYAPVPDERFLVIYEIPVTPEIKNTTSRPALLPAPVTVPVVEIPVQPTPTPVPPPVFNLSVDSYPSGALIVLDGNRTGTTPYVMTGLEEKTYTLNLTRAGYLAYGEVVNLESDTELEIPLTPAMDALFVTPGKSTRQNRYGGVYVTSFPDRLDLTIDGVQVKGGTPFLYYGLSEGLHTVQVVRKDKQGGPATYTRSVWIYRDALTTAHIDTEEVLMAKRVTINPGQYSGAEFTINGRYPSGRLPSTISAGCPGSFISVHKGDEFSSFLIPCTNQNTVTMNLADNLETHPSLLVSSSPDGAEIFIDGFRTGYTTPHTFDSVSAGLHRIMLSKPGLIPVQNIITVEIRDANTTPQKVFFSMENYGEGTIVIDSIPPGAAIYLNGWSPGDVTPHTFDHMKIGFYEVVIQMGPKPWVAQFELVPSRVSKVVADFKI